MRMLGTPLRDYRAVVIHASAMACLRCGRGRGRGRGLRVREWQGARLGPAVGFRVGLAAGTGAGRLSHKVGVRSRCGGRMLRSRSICQ